ncbi:CrcB family protein [Streptomyces sp. VRA16 Mangrove soil]|uniref:fluoride efflux transporter FluC n=1 Tax=Streptomyces sp. VRA16 Mangrove soil TaxID=2817434 RepID=UPI001A9D67E0|nr:CrcB family protein [Streptomyces sp. VRA16 Mangrove soil]MBO1335713.1 CrcB family protein [Streptomyces sp. VRA16 Mangrove soil]
MSPAARRPDVIASLFRHLFPHPPRDPSHRARLTVLVAVGGAAGAAARAGADLAWHASPAGFPWPTFTINVVGCAAMGVLMTLLHDRPSAPTWAGPVLGSGFLGGFTTFSAFATDVRRLLADGHTLTGMLYAVAGVACCLAAAACAAWLTAGSLPSPDVRETA